MGSRVSSSHMAHIAALAETCVLLTSRHGLRSASPSGILCRAAALPPTYITSQPARSSSGPVLPTSMIPGCSVASSAGREPPPSQRSRSSSDPLQDQVPHLRSGDVSVVRARAYVLQWAGGLQRALGVVLAGFSVVRHVHSRARLVYLQDGDGV